MAQSITFQSDPQRISVEQAARHTGTAFQRTRLSADPHLAVADLLRLHNLPAVPKAGTITHAGSASNFGIALVILGILMLIGGIVYHVQIYARPSPCATRHESGGPHSR